MNGGNGNGNGFWKITISGVVQILLLLGTIIAFFVTYDRSINETKAVVLQNTRDIATLTKTVSDINEQGTNFSRRGLPLETNALAVLAERTTQHDKTLAELTPKIERIQTTLEFILAEQKGSRR